LGLADHMHRPTLEEPRQSDDIKRCVSVEMCSQTWHQRPCADPPQMVNFLEALESERRTWTDE
jgi:hypothetical protein